MMKNKQAHKVQTLRTQILQKLEDGQFHSGESLANEFQLSRSAISNHVKALIALGLDIFSVKGRGYQLSGNTELLSQAKIVDALPQAHKSKLALIQIENVVTSTNDIVKEVSQDEQLAASGYCCVAEAQSAGRGRRGRTWVSPYASSLYFSMLWRFSSGYQAMAGLSLMVGVVVNDTLHALGISNCQLKWPNDIYYDGQKLAGILIEVEGQIGAGTSAIIGIGINVNLPQNIQGIDQAFTDLATISETAISKNVLTAMLIHKLWLALPVFEAQGMAPFIARWQAADLYHRKKVKLLMGDKSITGISHGIDNTGALLLNVNGKVEAFHGGEISVRPA